MPGLVFRYACDSGCPHKSRQTFAGTARVALYSCKLTLNVEMAQEEKIQIFPRKAGLIGKNLSDGRTCLRRFTQIGGTMFKNIIAAVLVSISSTSLCAQDVDIEAQIKEMAIEYTIGAFKASYAACAKDRNHKGENCRQAYSLIRQLLDEGMCKVPGSSSEIKSCLDYKSMSVIAAFDGVDGGFEGSSRIETFMTGFRSLVPQLDGTLTEEHSGMFAIACYPDQEPTVLLRLKFQVQHPEPAGHRERLKNLSIFV